MIKLEAIESFTLSRYNEIKNMQRKSIDTEGRLYEGDIFECEKELADYLLGNNAIHRAVVKVIEVEPEVNVKIDGDALAKEVIKQTKKKKTSKKVK